MNTLAGTTWTGMMSNAYGFHQPCTYKFGEGNGTIVSPGGLTFDYTQVVSNGNVTSFSATPSPQDFVWGGVGLLHPHQSPNTMTGTWNLQGIIWSFQVTLNS